MSFSPTHAMQVLRAQLDSTDHPHVRLDRGGDTGRDTSKDTGRDKGGDKGADGSGVPQSTNLGSTEKGASAGVWVDWSLGKLHRVARTECFNCGHVWPLRSPTFYAPVKKTSDGVLKPYGLFCSLPCVRRFIIDRNWSSEHLLFHYMTRVYYGITDVVPPAPPLELLRLGLYAVSDYRKQTDDAWRTSSCESLLQHPAHLFQPEYTLISRQSLPVAEHGIDETRIEHVNYHELPARNDKAATGSNSIARTRPHSGSKKRSTSDARPTEVGRSRKRHRLSRTQQTEDRASSVSLDEAERVDREESESERSDSPLVLSYRAWTQPKLA